MRSSRRPTPRHRGRSRSSTHSARRPTPTRQRRVTRPMAIVCAPVAGEANSIRRARLRRHRRHPSSEARGRRPAIRPGDQRRRRTARALHRRAPGASRRGRGADHLRDRLRHVAQRAAAGVEQVNGVPVRRFRVKHERDPLAFGRRSERVFDERALARRRARLARRRRADEPGARSTTSTRHAATYDFCMFFSYRYYHAYHGARAARATRDSGADGGARRGDRPVDVPADLPRRARADVQLARRARDDPGASPATSDVPSRRRRRRLGRARRTRSRRASGRNTTSAARSRSTSAGSTRTRAARSCSTSSSAYLREAGRRAVAGADRQLAAADSRASAHPPSRLPRRRRQVRRDGGRRAADHAVVLREPVDGGARSVGARPAGAGQREVRRAEGPVHPQQRRAVLRERARSSSRRCARSSRTAGWRAASAGTDASSSATTTTGR